MVSQRLTVLQVLPALEGGGVERGTLEVAAHLTRHGHRSLVISAGGRMVAQLEQEGSKHFTWPIGRKSLRTLGVIGPLRRFLEEQQVDILHVRSRLPAWICYLAWRGMPPDRRPRLVTTVHGYYSVNFYSAVMTRGETVIAVSASIADYLRENYLSWERSALRVIPRGIDPAVYRPDYRPSAEWMHDWQTAWPQFVGKRLLVLPGRITRLKGHHDFIELLAELKALVPDLHGIIVGEAEPRHRPYLAELKTAAKGKGLDNDLTFIGHRCDLREIFSVSTLVLSLSTQPEAFGRTVLEALALGIPVAGYAQGGVGELLSAMFPAGKVVPGDRRGLAETCLSILDAPCRPAALPAQLELKHMLDDTLYAYQWLVAAHEKGCPLDLDD